MINFSCANNDDSNQLKQLFISVFNESEKAASLFFYYNFIPQNVYVAKCNNKIISALFMIPSKLVTPVGVEKLNYLYGACTATEYRNKGVMSRLIKYAIAQQHKVGTSYTALLPASDSLYNYYAKLGFKPVFKAHTSTYNRQNNPYSKCDKILFNNYSFDNMAQLRFNICIDKLGAVLWTAKNIENAVNYSQIYGGNLLVTQYGYALYYVENAVTVNVQEIITTNHYFGNFINTFFHNRNINEVRVKSPVWLCGSGNTINNGMLYSCNDSLLWTQNTLPYLGLTMD